MNKHRVELFSDGVFAIVLTLLVLTLKVPERHGLAGLQEVAPPLAVHAASFLLVGVFWMIHHVGMDGVTEVNIKTLFLNLLTLFWITLLPFGALNAAERPLEPLGACVIAACSGAYLISGVATRRTARSSDENDPHLLNLRRKSRHRLLALAAANLLCAALVWISPWIGYVASLGTVVLLFLGPAKAHRNARLADDEPVASPEIVV